MVPHALRCCKFAPSAVTPRRMSRTTPLVCCLLTLFGLPASAVGASLQPLTVQEVETLPNGRAEASMTIAYYDALWFPAFTEPGEVCCQSLLVAPNVGFNIGLGSRVEVQASYELLLLDETVLGQGDTSNYGSGDARLFTKVRAWSEEGWRPAFGLRFGAKLPNGEKTKHLGTDQVDWGGELLGSKSLGPIDAHLNVGLQIWGNPGESGGQDDLFSYGFAVTSRNVEALSDETVGVRLLGEVAGLAGSRFGNDRSAVRGGVQVRVDPLTFFGGVSAGLIRESENIGGMLGVIWTFQTFAD